LTVRTTIHPTSAPTGTDDDIAGKDKLTPSVTLDRTGTLEAFSATSSQNPANSTRMDLL